MTKVEVEEREYQDLCLMRQFIEDNGLVIQYELFLDVLIQMGNHPYQQPQIIDVTDESGN